MTDTIARKIMKMTQDGYESIANAFSFTRERNWPEVELMVKKYVKEGFRTLDVGCGNGRLFPLLKNRGVTYVGLEQSERLLQICQDQYRRDTQDARFLRGSAAELPFEDGSFDVVFLLAVLHHFPLENEQKKVLEEVYRVMKPGGIVIMTNWNLLRLTLHKKSVWQFWREKQRMKGREFQAKYGVSKDELSWQDVITVWKKGHVQAKLYYHAFTLRKLLSLVKSLHLSVVEADYLQKGFHAHWWNGNNIVTVLRK
jgi:ubiquinone/menaquinone biosynthesis C-methylase UbiE